ncbi:MAG: ATP-binding protein [Eubacteriales bacterium]|nr:ATP-binding protein [Eubacteriales bacterium]
MKESRLRSESWRIEIISHPGPDRSVTPEGLKTFRVFNRRYRNRRIGDFLKELHLTEGRNTGFRKILRAIEKNGSPMPLFETDEYRSYFATTLYIHPMFLGEKDETTQETTQKSGLFFPVICRRMKRLFYC